ncbi:hypothetical protein [Acinetobacter suaedae]|uniref:Uncharacterized protein n=1 Tax=Acinetobacter suaedae TaxID=2609668 RepID=A0A5P1UU24_9GAMM|nr:hypothetical protein [Acinetobacter sp. C16S1]QER40114.1 hypothetical protein F2A31_10470 [Acinetobacter sp. C16S1]
MTSIIVNQTNDVGSVHVGLPLLIQLDSKESITVDPNEISAPVWTSIEKLKEEIDLYENWSQILTKDMF